MTSPNGAVDILRLITRLNIGGPAIQALMLTRELRDEFPTVLAAGRAPEEEGELFDPAVEVHRIPLTRPVHPVRDIQAIRRARTLLRATGARLIHTHMAKAGAVGRAAALTMRRRPILVHTFHGHILEGYFSSPVRRTFLSVERFLGARTDVLVAVSEQVRDELMGLGIGREDAWRVIPVGFDLEHFLAATGPSGAIRDKLQIGGDVPLVGVLGRLAPIKDHRTLLCAVSRLDGVHLAVLGDGELRSRLQVLAKGLGIAERVHFLGWRRDVAASIADMDIVALTSRNEGTPVSLIEAAACARPVVATAVGGVNEVVDDDRTGLLVPAGDVQAVADGIHQLLRSPERRRDMGLAGRESVRERFSKERLLGDIRSLYRDLLMA